VFVFNLIQPPSLLGVESISFEDLPVLHVLLILS
jgi:hypothetical protein